MPDECWLYIADYPIYSSSGAIAPVVMTIFRESDRRVYKRRLSERNSLVWEAIFYWDEGDETEFAYEYANTVASVRQRLDVMGFSMRKVTDDFYKALHEDMELRLATFLRIFETSESPMDKYWRWKRSTLQMVKNTSLEDWITAYREIISKKLTRKYDKSGPAPSENPLVLYILMESSEFLMYFPCRDIRCFLRFLTEACDDNDLIVQDISDGVYSGNYAEDYPACDMALNDLIGDYPINEKVLILTEGSTDNFVLERSLKLLYPHLYEYFSFMDFGLSNASGGASSLVNVVKAFIGSGINNRIVAIFDNDTAARSARKGFGKTVNVKEKGTLSPTKSGPT